MFSAALKSGAASTPTDPQFKYVTMLLHGDGTNGAQNNTFLDSSTNNFTITRNGNTTQGTFSPYGSNWSNYFDGTGDYLSVPTTSGQLGSGDFTIECWSYLISKVSIYPCIWGNYTSFTTGSLAIFAGHNSGTTTKYNVAINGTFPAIQSTDSIVYNQWTHLALVRSGTTITLYVNGVANGTYTSSATLNGTSGTSYIGTAGDDITNGYINGYLSNVRVVKGTAVYTSNFTPSTTPLTAITNTSLLTCQSNRFIDTSSNNFAITKYGDTSVQRFSPFSPTSAYSTSVIGGSGYFDGSGDYLSTSVSVASLTGNFTIECWTYQTSSANYPAFWTLGDSKLSTGLELQVTTTNIYLNTNNGLLISGASTTPLYTWTHWALVRSGTTITLYKNGVSFGTATSSATFSGNFYSGAEFYNGAIGSANLMYGYISDSRVVNGTAVYTSAFTPPTAPLTAITNTSLLLSYTNAGIFDNAEMNDLETVGNAQISTSVKKYGTGSMYFDGTGDWLKNVTTPLASLQGDFTIECWLYWTAHGNYGGIVSCANSDIGAAPTSGWAFVFYSTTNKLYFETGSGFSLQTTNTIPSSQWNHVAVVRFGSTITHYLNGVANGSGTSSAAFNVLTTDNYVVGVDRGLTNTLTGYIDDLRITKGVARYITTFTPPSSAFPNN
jgi:hypothetical protein